MEASEVARPVKGVVLAPENAFDVGFPDHILKRSGFANVAAIVEALSGLAESRDAG